MRPTALLRASEDGDTELVRKLVQEHAHAAVEYPKPAKCELLVRDPVGHPLCSERIYTVVGKRGERRLDSMRSCPLGTATWGRRLL